MGAIDIVLAMLLALVASSLLVRALPVAIPTPLVQIGLGALIAMFSDDAVRLDPDIFFVLFLPPLLFLDGWRIPKEGLLRDKGMILELALGLVFLTVIGMGLFIHWLIPPMPMPVAFALAAIVSPTDPVAVSAITSRIPVPRRLQHVLEGESLLNDASGLVCFRFAVAAVLTGVFSLQAAALTFLWLAIGGLAIGVGLTAGILMLKNLITQRFGEESGSQVVISLLLPFAAYLAAEHLHCSGILAAVSAGVTMSYMELTGHAQGSTRTQRTAAWDTVQFVLNGVMFVLLGEQLPGILERSANAMQETDHYNPAWLAVYVLAINLGLAVLRFGWVWGSLRLGAWLAMLRGETPGAPPRLRLVAAMSVAGVRGAITLAGVLTLPLTLADGSPFPARDLTIFLAAGVIIFSLLAANLALPRLLRGLNMPDDHPEGEGLEHARVTASEAAMRAIQRRIEAHAVAPEEAELHAEAVERALDHYRRRIDGERGSSESVLRARRGNQIERELRLEGLQAERDALYALARAQRLPDDLSRRLVREIDLLEERLKHEA